MIWAVLLYAQTAEDLRAHVEALASDAMEGRNAGSPGCDRAADYIAAKLRDYGYEVEETSFEFTRATKRVKTRNVFARLGKGEDVIVLGAHYDGLGKKGDEFNGQVVNAGAEKDVVWNGADGDASGCAALLEIARAMFGKPADRPVVFAFFSAGEYNQQGARQFMAKPPAKVVAMINLDMIGRNPDQPVELGGASSSPDWKKLVDAALAGSGLKIELAAPVSEAGDEIAFSEKRVPTLRVFTNFHEDYHAQTDHADKLDYARMAEIAKVVAALARAAAKSPPAWSAPESPAGESRKLGVKGEEVADEEAGDLGLQPGEGGVRIDAVEAGSPAELAGLKAGDVLVSIDGRALPRGRSGKSVVFAAIRRAKADEDVPVVVVRDRARVTLRLRFPSK